MNIQIATEALGFRLASDCADDADGPMIVLHGDQIPLPDYCGDASAALLVVEYFMDRG